MVRPPLERMVAEHLDLVNVEHILEYFEECSDSPECFRDRAAPAHDGPRRRSNTKSSVHCDIILRGITGERGFYVPLVDGFDSTQVVSPEETSDIEPPSGSFPSRKWSDPIARRRDQEPDESESVGGLGPFGEVNRSAGPRT